MSAKQLRKLRELREAADSAAKLPEKQEEQEESEEGSEADQSEEEEEEEGQQKAAGFAALLGSSSESEQGGPEPSAPESRPTETPGASAAAKRRRRKAKAAAAALEEEEEELLLQPAQAEEDPPAEDSPEAPAASLAMRRSDFSVEAERRRATGRGGFVGLADARSAPRGRRLAARPRGAAEGRTVHHRRLFIVVPTAEEAWPKPDDCFEMLPKADEFGAPVFDFAETASSKRTLDQLRRLLASQDPNLLQQFLQQNPFCVDGLLTLAEHLRSQASHEQSFQLVRRAAYALECSFAAGFSPFSERSTGTGAKRPSVVLKLPEKDPTWPGWSWLRALWMYMQGLAGQGLHRTALEMSKLLLFSTLPRDPCRALFCFDYFCLRSRHYDVLAQAARDLVPQLGLDQEEGMLTDLGLVFPNVAYSLALAAFLKGGSQPPAAALNEVSLDDVMPPEGHPPCEEGPLVHALLMRALLLFPVALRPLLEEAGAKLSGPAPGGSTSRQTWSDLMGKPPFSNAVDFRHATHAAAHDRVCGAYAKRCGALWRADLVLRWLHSCAGRIVGMHESSVFASELAARRLAWCEAPLALGEALEKDYPDLLPEEGSPEAPKLPPVLEDAWQARLKPPQQWDEDGRPIAAGWNRHVQQQALEPVPPNISIYSPPLLVFFQSLMPWGELDRSGVAVEPVGWMDVARGGAGVLKSCVLFLLGAACDVGRLLAQLWKSLLESLRK